jgi:hypothetical protein
LEQIFPLPEVVLFAHCDQRWYRFGCQLPTFDVPVSADYQPLPRVLTCYSFEAQKPLTPKCEPTSLTFVSDDRQRPTTAAMYRLSRLIHWIENVPTPRLKGIQAAHCGNEALLLGDRLPVLPESERFWGSAVLMPLGYRPDPFLPEGALCEALGLCENEIILWRHAGVETIDRRAFAPLTRAGVRLVAQVVD